MRVLKFGGTSVASAGRLAGVADIVAGAAATDRVVVVVSALAGVTDALVRLVDVATAGGAAWEAGALALLHRHLDCLRELGGEPPVEASLRRVVRELAAKLAHVAHARAATAAERDAVLATGERLTVPLAALALRRNGLAAVEADARELVVTDSSFGAAEPDLEATAGRASTFLFHLAPGHVPVVAGFVGADRQGRTTTLGRGGSDLTASVLGAALGADVVEIWTDVPGVLAAPPCDVPHAATLPDLSHGEAATLAALGAKVLYAKTIGPLETRGIPLVVRNTFDPAGARTRVSATPAASAGQPRAVTTRDGGVLVAVEGLPETGRERLAAAFGALLKAQGGTLEPCRPGGTGGAVGLVRGLASAAVRDLCRHLAVVAGGGVVRAREGVGVVALVGAGVGANRVAAARARQALAAARLPVLAELAPGLAAALVLVVQRGHLRDAVWVLHEALLAPGGADDGRSVAAPAAAGRRR